MSEGDTLSVTAEERRIVIDILKLYVPEYEVRAFGSRVTGRAKKYSDLDLVIITESELSSPLLADLNNAFSESDLPFKVDVVEWCEISDEFKEMIKQHFIVIDALNV